MPYRVDLEDEAKDQLRRLPPQIALRVRERLRDIEADPRSRALKLKGELGYRVRAGDYRILFDIDDHSQTVSVWRIAHRGRAYR